MVSAVRALHADIGLRGFRQMLDQWLPKLGQPLYGWPPPDGFPDVSKKWAANLLPRWNFALALAGGQIEGVNVPMDKLMEIGGVESVEDGVEFFGGVIFNRLLSEAERLVYQGYAGGGKIGEGDARQRLMECVALMVASPQFQWT